MQQRSGSERVSERAAVDSELYSAMHFRFAWRDYQARVLEAFEHHLLDRRFHIVAAPGSGKTVLGLEVVRRIAQPALVLAPTLTVREQWIDRLLADFLNWEDAAQLEAQISRNVDAPAALTVSTYQAVSSAFQHGAGNAFIAGLRAAGISVLVVDEAHHLRRQWWKNLQAIQDALPGLTVVALTATPPYDVPQAEWNRYAGFCGPIDEEVGIPELVASGDLCPHQDYVWFSVPTPQEQHQIGEFTRHVRGLLLDLELDVTFAARLAHQPAIRERTDAAGRLADCDFFLAIALYLRQVNARVPASLLDDLGIAGVDLPPLDLEWHRALLQGLLFEHASEFADDAEFVQQLERYRKRLYDIGAIERRRVELRSTPRTSKLLRHSAAKLRSVAEIVQLEIATAPDRVRCVVLTDHIRQADFPARDVETPKPFSKLGVVPIFETLRRMRLPGSRLGVLCGSLTIAPQASLPLIHDVAPSLGFDPNELSIQPLPHAPDFCRVSFSGDGSRRSVALMTRLFELGEVNVLIGTAALLGEGWDAPCLNTLVLASVIGSFVTSNQMRGRAIRIQPGTPNKVANIWHLACVQPETPEALQPAWRGARTDWNALLRRFDAFPGLRAGDGAPVIEDGPQRLGLSRPADPKRVALENRRTRARAVDRIRVANRWRESSNLSGGRLPRPIRELHLRRARLNTRFVGWLFGECEQTGARGWFQRALQRRRLKRMAGTVLAALRESNHIDSQHASIVVGHAPNSPGTGDGHRCTVQLADVRPSEQVAFVTALAELFDPLDSPRYLLSCGPATYAVPDRFCANRAQAERFSALWRRHVGRHRLVYTQTPEGRALLLGAKRQALVDRFAFRTETRVSWR
jgi:superfamily II DNA or RNA helicase